MYEIKKNGTVFTSKFVGTEPSSYKKRIYRAVVSQRLRNTALQNPNIHDRVHKTSSLYSPP
jgi:citrate lyase synthetase